MAPSESRPRSIRLSRRSCTAKAFSVAPSTKPGACFRPPFSTPAAQSFGIPSSSRMRGLSVRIATRSRCERSEDICSSHRAWVRAWSVWRRPTSIGCRSVPQGFRPRAAAWPCRICGWPCSSASCRGPVLEEVAVREMLPRGQLHLFTGDIVADAGPIDGYIAPVDVEPRARDSQPATRFLGIAPVALAGQFARLLGRHRFCGLDPAEQAELHEAAEHVLPDLQTPFRSSTMFGASASAPGEALIVFMALRFPYWSPRVQCQGQGCPVPEKFNADRDILPRPPANYRTGSVLRFCRDSAFLTRLFDRR